MKVITGGVTAARGYSAWGLAGGIKQDGLADLALVYSEYPAKAAGVFTTNKVKAAPVIVSREHLRAENARAIIINSGNANACVGQEGFTSARAMTKAVAENL